MEGKRRIRAFTLIELVIVIVVIVLLTFIALFRMPDMASLRINMAQRKVASDIRYAQSLAMDLRKRTGLLFTVASDDYSVYIEDPPGTWNLAKDPSTGKNFTVQLNSDVFSGVEILLVYFNASNNALVFDKWGNPYGYNVASGTATSLNNPAGVRLTGTNDVRVERGTGRVYLVP